MGTNISDYRAQGAVIIERLRTTKTPAALAPHIKRFRGAHEQYEAAAVRVDGAFAKRADALAAIGAADTAFDATIDTLADKLVGAGLGKRANPFKDYGAYNPSDLKGLAYATQLKETRALVAALRKRAPRAPADVTAALKACEAAASRVDKALAALTAPQTAYTKALAARDALLPDWEKALRKLRKFADAELDDEPEAFAALFAPPEAVQKPVKRRATKKSNGKGTPAPQPTG